VAEKDTRNLLICVRQPKLAARLSAAQNRQGARILEHLSRCVTIAGCGHRARSAVLRGQRSLADLRPIRTDQGIRRSGRAGQARRGLRRWDALRLGLWSNAGVFVRVWEYEVPGDRAEAFTAAYAADGAWGELFGRAAGFLGTELYRDAARADRFLTIDLWQDEQNWRSFLNAFGSAYEALDAQLEGLAAAERSLFEGSS
jgi:heme-degrading monooxygenase HmoA